MIAFKACKKISGGTTGIHIRSAERLKRSMFKYFSRAYVYACRSSRYFFTGFKSDHRFDNIAKLWIEDRVQIPDKE